MVEKIRLSKKLIWYAIVIKCGTKERDNMLGKLNTILNYVIGSFIGVFIGHSIYKYFDYTKNSGLYEMQSAPWYTSIQVNGLAVILIVFIAIIIKFLLKWRMRRVKSEIH